MCYCKGNFKLGGPGVFFGQVRQSLICFHVGQDSLAEWNLFCCLQEVAYILTEP